MSDTKSQELNLIQIFSKIGEWLKKVSISIAKVITYSARMSIKYWYLFTLVLALSILASIYLSRPKAHKYHAETVLHASFSEISFVNDVIDQLSASINNKSGYNLARFLEIPDSIAKGVLKIERFNIIDYLDDETPDLIDFKKSHSLKDTTNLIMNDRVYFRLTTNSPNNLDAVYDALIHYLNSNQRLINEFEYNKEIYTNTANLLDREISRIDSLAQITYLQNEENLDLTLYNDGKRGEKIILGERKKPLVYEDLLKTIDNRFVRGRKLEMAIQPVYSTTGFVVKGPINGRFKYIIYGFIYGVIGGVIASTLFSKKKKLKEFIEQSKK